MMLVPILQVFGGGIGVAETARGYAEAALLARSKLAELTAEKLREGDSSGSFEERGYRWQASVTADYSDVTLPDNTIVGMPVRPGQEERRRPRTSATSGGGSTFGESRRGLGSSDRRSLFGQSRSSFGGSPGSQASPSRSGSSFGSPRAGSAARPGIGGGEEGEGGDEPQFIPYRVAVTVEWGDAFSGSGAVTLTTLRLVQPDLEQERGAQ
jgi:hypothetical protein